MPRVIDLSHPLAPGMPVYPGDPAPRFEQAATVAGNGYALKLLTLGTHTGTHLDAPAHMLPGGPCLSDLPASRFVGPARVLDLRGVREVGEDFVRPLLPTLSGAAFVILRTGWEAHWGRDEYFRGYPVLTPGAATLLAGLGLSGLGLDAPGVDRVEDEDAPVHKALFAAGLVIVENLANLDALPDGEFTFCAPPLPIADGDGSPVRAFALSG
ncbi:cyclase family protein [Desulfocurvus sp. DL9XJH121]